MPSRLAMVIRIPSVDDMNKYKARNVLDYYEK